MTTHLICRPVVIRRTETTQLSPRSHRLERPIKNRCGPPQAWRVQPDSSDEDVQLCDLALGPNDCFSLSAFWALLDAMSFVRRQERLRMGGALEIETPMLDERKDSGAARTALRPQHRAQEVLS